MPSGTRTIARSPAREARLRWPSFFLTFAVDAQAAAFIGNLRIVLDSVGLPHFGATANAYNQTVGFYAYSFGADLTASWNDLAPTTIKGKSELVGHLQVSSDGTAAADGYHITCYLSDTSAGSASEPVLGKATVSLAAGASRVLTFDFDPAKAPSGKYIVAQIATKPGEANPNNTAAIMIP